jgi:5'-nucleotidase, C-terminal domain
VDLEWSANADDRWPTVHTRLVPTASFAEDASMRARVDGHMRAVHALEHATLLSLADGEALSSIGTRHAQTSLGSRICSLLRDELGADACVFNGGGIRGNRDYRQRFTYGDLKGEVPFDNEVVIVSLPGSVLADAVAASRAHAPADSGAFLQVDDRMTVDENHRLIAVDRAPWEPAREYRVAIIRNLFFGMDHVEPLVAFGHEHRERIPPAGSGREVKMLLVDALSLELFASLGPFDAIDENHDGILEPNELADAITRATAEPASEITVELLLRALDRDKDRHVSRTEADEATARAGKLRR